MKSGQYISMVIESNPLLDQSFGKTIVLRRMEDIKAEEVFYIVDVDDVEWLRTDDFKQALVLYNLMRVSSNIGTINKAYDDLIKTIDAKIEREGTEDRED